MRVLLDGLGPREQAVAPWYVRALRIQHSPPDPQLDEALTEAEHIADGLGVTDEDLAGWVERAESRAKLGSA